MATKGTCDAGTRRLLTADKEWVRQTVTNMEPPETRYVAVGDADVERMRRAPIEISPAGRDRLGRLASVFARAFVDDPMMRWSLVGTQEPLELLDRCFTYFLERALDWDVVWETADANGAAVWIPPGRSEAWEEHPWSQQRILELSEDGGGRYESFWDWIESHIPDEPLWLLDSIAVDQQVQGQGYGRAMIELGLAKAAFTGCGAILSTGTERNVAIYKKCGFSVVDHLDAPDGGPHIWFMRWNP
jgi:GNAT superfamily N-acetyltransferase